jgi:hypothetical protein
MADLTQQTTTNPDAEAKALAAAAKPATPPPLPTSPAALSAAAATLVVNPANVAAAIASIEAAQKAIATAGNVTSDLSLAMQGCVSALKWLNIAAAKAAANGPKT